MATEAQKRAARNYNKKLRCFIFRFNINTDRDVIEEIERHKNKTDYIRNLVRGGGENGES